MIGTGRPAVQVLLSPPLTVDEGEIDVAIEAVDDAISSVFG
jgi:4-aminobutyrate aminotransferase-like enzyme